MRVAYEDLRTYLSFVCWGTGLLEQTRSILACFMLNISLQGTEICLGCTILQKSFFKTLRERQQAQRFVFL